jgi:hypothetical protein
MELDLLGELRIEREIRKIGGRVDFLERIRND